MFTLISADEDEEHEITDTVEVAELFCALAMTALEMGLDPEDLHALVDAAIERGGADVN